MRIALLAALFPTLPILLLASCSKDDEALPTEEVVCVEPVVDTSFAVTATEYIAFSSRGIIYVVNHNEESPRWVLSYEEIAKRLGIDAALVPSIHITRDRVLDDGLWRFIVRFDGQEKGSEYGIDVDPETGEIVWTYSMTEMPDGEVTLNMQF